MVAVLLHRKDPRFMVFANYKVMFSSLLRTFSEAFPRLERDISDMDGLDLADYWKFAFTRNPYTRLLSAYLDKCVFDPSRQIDEGKIILQPSQRQLLVSLEALGRFKAEIAPGWIRFSPDDELYRVCRANLEALREVDFCGFVEAVEWMMSEGSTDPHFQPQFRHLFRDGRMRVDTLYRMEDIEEAWREVCRRLGSPLRLSSENRTAKVGASFFFGGSLRRRVFHLYEEDFYLLGYGSTVPR